MAKETVSAKYAVKDAEGNIVKDAEGKTTYAICNAEYDFGENITELMKKAGEDAVFTNSVANMRVSLQSRIRSLHKAGLTPDAIQDQVNSWVPGVAAAKVAVDPIQNTISQFANWPKAKQQEFLKKLQGK